jgi:voltage-dependent calcium channel T type alpha-1G
LYLPRQIRYQYQQKKEGLLPRTPENVFSPQRIRCHHPKCPKVLNNHYSNRGSTNKLTNFQEQSKLSNNQINSIQAAPLNGNGNVDNISLDYSETQSINHNTLSGTMDEKQKMLLLKIENNSIAAPSTTAQACVHDSEYVNVSE